MKSNPKGRCEVTDAKIVPATHDNRKVYPQVYGVKRGTVHIQHIPKLNYVSQDMTTAFHMDWAGRPEPIDESWVVWKIVNQLKQITKTTVGYKFKLMPPEIIWRESIGNGKHSVTQMMQVPECITEEMYDEAKTRVARNLRGIKIPQTTFISADTTLCAQKLHVGHYRDTQATFEEITEHVEKQRFRIVGSRREVYLTPAMMCHPPESWRTIVRVEIEEC